MNYKLIVMCKSHADEVKLTKLVHTKERPRSYWMVRRYSRSEWIGVRSPIKQAYVIGCRSKTEQFKLALLFATEEYKGV